MRAVNSSITVLALLCAVSDAFTLGMRATSQARVTPQMNFVDDLFGKKSAPAAPTPSANDNAALNAVMTKPMDEWSKDDKKTVTRIASNWGDRGGTEGYTFFNGPTPKTGEQADLQDFFAFADVDAPPQLAVFGGIFGVALVAVVATLITG